MHNINNIDRNTDLPEKILDYNATKAAVNQVEQLFHNAEKR